MKMRWCAVLILSSAATLHAALEADAARGAEVFRAQKCTACHMVDGVGGTTGPDLGRRLDRDYTPAGMVSRMWNHAPKMWEAMRTAGMTPPRLSEQDAADLFAYFMAKRFFEAPGDAGRGKRVFARKCNECHTGTGPGGPVSKWTTLSDSVDLAERMWNHSLGMQQALTEKKKKWPELQPQEMTDLLVYLQNLPETRGMALTFRLPSGAGGKQLLEGKGCTRCHTDGMKLEGRLGNKSMTEITTSMWNHAPGMRWMAQPLNANELREILAYVWQPAYYKPRGNASRGESMYRSRCGSCHGSGGIARDLAAIGKDLNTVGLTAALWQHGPQMLERAKADNKAWPEMSEAEVANLLSFLDSAKK